MLRTVGLETVPFIKSEVEVDKWAGGIESVFMRFSKTDTVTNCINYGFNKNRTDVKYMRHSTFNIQ